MMASFLLLLAAAAAAAAAVPSEAEQVFSVYDFGARGDGKHNDTAAIQAAMNAAAAAGGGVAHLPHNGTFLTGGGLNALGHAYDGVTLRVDGAVTIPGPTAKPAWPTPEQCGSAEHVKGSGGKANPFAPGRRIFHCTPPRAPPHCAPHCGNMTACSAVHPRSSVNCGCRVAQRTRHS